MCECRWDKMAAGVFTDERGVAGVGVGGHGRVEGVIVVGLGVVDAVVLDGDSGLEDWVTRLAERDWENAGGF